MRALFDQGLTLDAAHHRTLEDELAAARARIAELENELDTARDQSAEPGPPQALA